MTQLATAAALDRYASEFSARVLQRAPCSPGGFRFRTELHVASSASRKRLLDSPSFVGYVFEREREGEALRVFYRRFLLSLLAQEAKSTALHLQALPANNGQTVGRRF